MTPIQLLARSIVQRLTGTDPVGSPEQENYNWTVGELTRFGRRQLATGMWLMYDDAAPPEEATDNLLRALKASAPTVCSSQCPSVWYTGTAQPHSDICKQVQEAITNFELEATGYKVKQEVKP